MRRKAPVNFSLQEEKLRELRVLAKLLDEAVTIPGTSVRVGFDSLLGLVPGVGDVLTGLLSAYIVWQASKLGVPKRILLRMVLNVGVDVLVGTVPVAGDIFDVLWKANKKNLALLEKHLNEKLPASPVIDV